MTAGILSLSLLLHLPLLHLHASKMEHWEAGEGAGGWVAGVGICAGLEARRRGRQGAVEKREE